MKIIKKQGGLVFRDQFTSLSNWLPTSPANISIGTGLVVTHNQAKDVRVLRDIPQNVNVLELAVDYTPLLEGDAAGIILYATDNTVLEVVESVDDTQGNITDYKIIRQNNEFNVFILRDGEYEFVTSSDSLFTKFGFVTKQGDTSFESLKALEVYAARNQFLTFTALPAESYVKVTENGNSVTEAVVDGTAKYEMKHIEQTLKVEIYTEDHQLIYESEQLYAAGDEYYASSELILLKNGVPLSLEVDNEIGSIAGSVVEKQLELHNPLAYPIQNINVQISEYVDFYGYTLADVALDDNNAPGTYVDDLLIETLNPGESVLFWFKFDKTNDTSGKSTLGTYIAVSHD